MAGDLAINESSFIIGIDLPVDGGTRPDNCVAPISAGGSSMDSSLIRSDGSKLEPQTGQISVAVIGGGIGGLAAALSLLPAGLDVHVYEQAREMREVGAGIQVSPNATRILNRLGLAETLATVGVQPLTLRQRRWDDGRTLSCAPLGDTVEDAC